MTNNPNQPDATPNTVQFASVRIIAEDLEGLVRFYEAVTGAVGRWLTDDFVELVTPSATVAISHPRRVSFLGEDRPRKAANHSVIFEFLVVDVDAVFSRLQNVLGEDLTVVRPPTMMPWGNVSLLIRDPDGSLINLYTPVTPEALELQHHRQPQLPTSKPTAEFGTPLSERVARRVLPDVVTPPV